MLSNMNDTIWYQSFVFLQLNGFEYSKWLYISFWSIVETLIGSTVLQEDKKRMSEVNEK